MWHVIVTRIPDGHVHVLSHGFPDRKQGIDFVLNKVFVDPVPQPDKVREVLNLYGEYRYEDSMITLMYPNSGKHE